MKRILFLALALISIQSFGQYRKSQLSSMNQRTIYAFGAYSSSRMGNMLDSLILSLESQRRAAGYLPVGNSSGIAVDVPISGDATLSSAGALSVIKVNGSTWPSNASGVLTNNGSGTLTWGTGGGGTWGSITGTLSAQTDLNTALNGKLSAASNLSDVNSASTSRTNLGLGTLATANSINNSNWTGTQLSVANGGTGATSASIGAFNNITGYTAAGATGTTSTNLVFSTSPVLTTPNLGTPSAVTLTNATGLPLTSGVTGALPVANGGTGGTSAGSTLLNNITGLSNAAGSLQNDGSGNLSWANPTGLFWGLNGTSTGTGSTTITYSTPNWLLHNGTWTATADNQFAEKSAYTLTANSTTTLHVYGSVFANSLTSGANNQTLASVLINPTYTDAFSSTLTADVLDGTNGIGSTNAGFVTARSLTGSVSSHEFAANSFFYNASASSAAFDDKMTLASGASAGGHHISFQARPNYANTSNLANGYGFADFSTFTTGSTFTFYASYTSVTGISSKASTFYGYYAPDAGSPIGSSYAFYAAAQQSFFGGGVNIGVPVVSTGSANSIFAMTGAANTGMTIAESTLANLNLSQTNNFTSGGGTIANNRVFRIQGPTYTATTNNVTMTYVSTLAIDQPVFSTNIVNGNKGGGSANTSTKTGFYAISAQGGISVWDNSFTGHGFFIQSGNGQTQIGGGGSIDYIQFNSGTINASTTNWQINAGAGNLYVTNIYGKSTPGNGTAALFLNSNGTIAPGAGSTVYGVSVQVAAANQTTGVLKFMTFEQSSINLNGNATAAIVYGIDYNPAKTNVTGLSAHYPLLLRDASGLSGIGLGATLPTATLHVLGTVKLDANVTLPTAGNKLIITEGTNGSVGQTTLVSGTKAITISGVTTSSRCFAMLVTPSGTTLTTTYQCACTSNTITLQANVAAGTINTADGSTLNYWVVN